MKSSLDLYREIRRPEETGRYEPFDLPEAPGPRPPRRPSTLSRVLFILACVIVGVAGLALGGFAGAPSMVERAALKAVARIESRLGVQLSASAVEWTWDGKVRAHDVVVKTGDAVLATARAIEIDATVALLDRHVRVDAIRVLDPELAVVRGADGQTNFHPILEALRKGQGSGPGTDRLPGGVTLEAHWPTLAMTNARVLVAPGVTHLPFGLTVPPEVTFEGGTITLTPDPSGTDAQPWRERAMRLDTRFASTSLDPGQSLRVAVEGTLGGDVTRIEVGPERPVRFWLGTRVVGVGGVALTPEQVELGPLQLSVPLGKDRGTGQVAAAATVERVVIRPGPMAVYDAVRASAAEAHAGASPGLVKRIEQVLLALDEVRLEGPVLAAAIGADGTHGFEDLVPAVNALGEAPLPTMEAARDDALVNTMTEASLRASEKLLAKKATVARPAAAPTAPLPVRVTKKLETIDALAHRIVPKLVRALAPIVMKRLVVADGELSLDVAGQSMTVTGLALDLGLREGRREVTLKAADAAGLGPVEATATLDDKRLDLSVKLRELPLRLVPKLADLAHLRGPGDARTATRQGRIEGLDLHLTTDLQGDAFEAAFAGRLRDGIFHYAAIAGDPLVDLDIEARGNLRWSSNDAHLSLTDLVLASRGVQITGALDISEGRRAPKLNLRLDLPETPLQQVIDAIPRGFAPLLEGLRMEGTLRWPFSVQLDTADPARIQIDSAPVGRSIRVLSLGQRVDFATLRSSHSYVTRLADGSPGTRLVGPMTGSWVPLSEITPYLPLALTTTEDGTFYSNDGISTHAMKESLVTNLDRGAFVRGASTITQQLVKNLYFGGDKTISRKLQEVFLAWQVAQQLSKDEVMALYLNTIEFGPGIYGIGDASWHWFGKRPIDLDLTEAIFLASIIPGPRRYYSFFEQGAVTPRWKGYLEALLKVMVDRKKITPDELLAAAPYEPLFRGHGGGYHDKPPVDFDAIPERAEDDIDPR